MDYVIAAVHAKFNGSQLTEVAVLWESDGSKCFRASYAVNRPMSGYLYLRPGDELNNKLIQAVAAAGLSLPDEQKKSYFAHIEKEKD